MQANMNLTSTTTKSLALACALVALPLSATAVESASFEFGSGDKTKMVRLGLQWNWEKQWWKSNGTHIGGYWNLSAALWRGSRHLDISGNRQHLGVFGVTPVFRLQNDNLRGWYAEAGIGAHVLSGLYDNGGKQLSTHFQFGDHIGAGYVFSNGTDLGLSIQHFSNGGFKKPNDGVNFAILRLSHPLQ